MMYTELEVSQDCHGAKHPSKELYCLPDLSCTKSSDGKEITWRIKEGTVRIGVSYAVSRNKATVWTDPFHLSEWEKNSQ